MRKKIIIRSATTNKKICSFKIESKLYKQIESVSIQKNESIEDFIIKALRDYILKSYID